MTNEQKSASPRGVINGDELTYTIKFKNEGSTTENADTKLHQLIFHDKPNSKITLNYTNVSAKVGTSTVSCTSSKSGTTLIINFGNYALARAETLTITINATVNASSYTSSNIENAIELAQIKNRNGENIKNILNNYDLTKNKDYVKLVVKANINKYAVKKYRTTDGNIVSGQTPTPYSRSTTSESNKSSNPVGVDAKDIIIFRVDIKNEGIAVNSISFTDDAHSGLEYINYSTTDTGQITHGDWSKSGMTFTYGKSVSSGESIFLYLLFSPKEDQIAKNNVTMDNTVTISKMMSGTTNIVGDLSSSSKKTSTEKVKLRTYYFDIEKSIVRVNSRSTTTSPAYVEPGDYVIMEVKVKNTSATNKVYGNLYSIAFSDISTITNGYDIGTYVDVQGFSSTIDGTYSRSLNRDHIKAEKINNSNYDYTVSFSSSLTTEAGSETRSVFIKYYVKTTVKNKNLLVKNTATLTKLENRNGVNLYSKLDKINKVKTSASASFYIKQYKLAFSKTVNKIESIREPNLASDSGICEYGDKITFRISIKNTGNDSNKFGLLRYIEIEDIIDTSVFSVISSRGSRTNLSYNATNNKITYSDSTGLALNTEIYMDITVEVIYKSKTTKTLKNVATIKNVKNVNEIDIYKENNIDVVKANRYTHSASLKYQVYRVNINKYISKLNSTDINDRQNLNNTNRNNSPVEVEKGDVVTYTIIFKNNATGSNNDKTKLYQIVLKDIAEEGLSIRTNGISVKNAGTNVAFTSSKNNDTLTINLNNYVLDMNNTLNITIQADVIKSNFYLYNLENKFEIASIKNRNDKDIIDILNGYPSSYNKDYVRLKNLIIAGNVWNDENRDGLINTNENGIGGIEVRLIDITNKKFISTYTNNNGDYSFGTANAKGYKINNLTQANGALSYTTTSTEDTTLMCDSYGRVVKATKRNDTTGNYNRTTSQYIEYIIQYTYDGVHYYTTTYAGTNNINMNNLSIKNDYKKDSNARESEVERNQFYDSLDTIYYNKARGKDGTEMNLDYTKSGHKSTLNTPLLLNAYSFGDGFSITPLWLKTSPGNSVLGESEYLKYINLGLIYKMADLEITNDVDSVTTYINGERTKYQFGQGNNPSSEFAGEYRTGGENRDKFYQLKIYSSDYYYQSNDYKNEAIKNYKRDTELEIQVKYKVTIYNKSNNYNQTYARVREITDYYSTTFNTDLGAETTVKVYNRDGDLESTQLTNFVVSDNYRYSKTRQYADKSGNDVPFNKLYLQTPIDIPEGGNAVLYLTFTIDKENHHLSNNDLVKLLKINDETIRNIVEINAYSIYKNGSESLFGMIDEDSNPGNVSKDNLTQNNGVREYEDDTYEAKLKITKRTNVGGEKSERSITGYVWEDVRSETVGDSPEIQYVGDGKFDDSKLKNENAMSLDMGNNKRHYVDHKIEGVTAHLIEEVRIKQPDGSYKLYEYDWSDSESLAYKELSPSENQKFVSTSGADGKYELISIIPGIYKTRFYYGHKDEDGIIGDKQLKYNGQDFKSTQYKGVVQGVAGINKIFAYDDNQTNDDLKLMMVENENDAMDDELRRLENMAYAEVQTNDNQVVINQTKIEKATGDGKEDAKKEFIQNTYMYADTGFMRLNTEFTKNADNNIELNRKTYDYNTIYTKINISEYNYKIDHIDFGIQYRPKTAVALNKYISSFKVILSDKTVLADIKFKEVYDKNTHALIGMALNRDESKGLDNLMITDSTNDSFGPLLLTVDKSLMHGATVIMNYVYCVKNEGEVDRIGIKLDELRESYERIISSPECNGLIDPTISIIAYGRLKNDYGLSFDRNTYDGDTIINDIGNNLNDLKYKLLYDTTSGVGYYGQYLGTTYYTSKINDDVIAKTKIKTILDYVPADLDFNQDQNIGENHYWTSISLDEAKQKYLDNAILEKRTNDTNYNIYDYMNKTYYDYLSRKSNIVISVDEGIYTVKDNEQNKSLSRLLIPIKADDFSMNNQDGTTKSSGIIKISSSLTLSNGKELTDYWYTNTGEIVQIISQSGRSTPKKSSQKIDVIGYGEEPKTAPNTLPDNFEIDESFQEERHRVLYATIGNYQPKNIFDVDESDMATADPILLLPPTGIVPFYLKQNSKKIFIITIGIVIIIGIMIIGQKKKVSIKKMFKRKKIRLSFKKYYK